MYVSADLPVEGRAAAPAAVPFAGPYRLTTLPDPVRIRETAILTLSGGAEGRGSEVVAFDRTRSGMVDLRLGPEGSGRISFPDSGTYAVWARVGAGEGQRLVPFTLAIQP